MSEVTKTRTLNMAFDSICKKRIDDSCNSDIWDLRRHWPRIRRKARLELLSGSYHLSPVSVVGNINGHRLTRWSAIDAVILKAISIVITPCIQKGIDRRCYHIKGNGGLKVAVNTVRQAAKDYQFVVKSDIADYYASMDHAIVMEQCSELIKDVKILEIIKQYLNRVEVKQGEHSLIDRGIVKGCPLSPLMGAIMLKSLDKMVPKDCAYARYQDDWVILTKTRGQLRNVVKKMHDVVHRLGFKLAYAKTFIGRIKKGFDFLGYRINRLGIIGLSPKTIENHKEKLLALYEQHASDTCVQQYKKNWHRWVRAGFEGAALRWLPSSCAIS